jgi:polysaccharide deacetylase family protein (PEP-CTERM system associated)
MLPGRLDEERSHILTVSLEDYFHVRAFSHVIQQRQWYRFEPRLEQSLTRALDLFDEFGCRATFFVLGWVAEAVPELLQRVVERGHEVADRGYYPRSLRDLTREEFRDDLRRSRAAIERAIGRPVRGYRSARLWPDGRHLWALEVLAEEGYRYDASLAPLGRGLLTSDEWRTVHRRRCGDREIWEVPVSSTRLLGLTVPIAGGNYLRQLPKWVIDRGLARLAAGEAPLVFYFNIWELDAGQPRVGGATLLNRMRHYRNLHRMPERLRSVLARGPFHSISEYLGLPAASEPEQMMLPVPGVARPTPTPLPSATVPAREAGAPGGRPRTPITIVVPCFNETLVIPYLANTLRSVEARLGERYELSFIFVDDRSADDTLASLRRQFGNRPDCRVLSHEQNLGVAAAIRTGLHAATTEIVCSMDADCTYDPHDLERMIPLLTEGVDMVTASPYHPDGGVRNVPAWRLVLSRGLSRMYRLVLRNRLETYTSCFRVYRRSSVLPVGIVHNGFLGVLEQLARLDLAGGRIIEYPTMLESRILGRSKLKVVRTIAGHLWLFQRLASARLFGRPPMPGRATAPALRRDSTAQGTVQPDAVVDENAFAAEARSS